MKLITTWKLEFSVDAGTAVIFAASASNDSGAAFSDVCNAGASNGTTKVDLIAAPAADNTRIVENVNIFNGDSVARTVTVNLDIDGTDRMVWQGLLAVGAVLQYTKEKGWWISNPAGNIGYTLAVQALTSSPADAATTFFGNLPKAPMTVAAASRILIRKAGILKIAEIYCYSGTAGTAEAWSLYVRVNNTTDHLIQTVATAAAERVFSNAALAVPLSVGDYVEIKSVQPTWATNPLTTIFGGYLYIE